MVCKWLIYITELIGISMNARKRDRFIAAVTIITSVYDLEKGTPFPASLSEVVTAVSRCMLNKKEIMKIMYNLHAKKLIIIFKDGVILTEKGKKLAAKCKNSIE